MRESRPPNPSSFKPRSPTPSALLLQTLEFCWSSSSFPGTQIDGLPGPPPPEGLARGCGLLRPRWGSRAVPLGHCPPASVSSARPRPRRPRPRPSLPGGRATRTPESRGRRRGGSYLGRTPRLPRLPLARRRLLLLLAGCRDARSPTGSSRHKLPRARVGGGGGAAPDGGGGAGGIPPSTHVQRPRKPGLASSALRPPQSQEARRQHPPLPPSDPGVRVPSPLLPRIQESRSPRPLLPQTPESGPAQLPPPSDSGVWTPSPFLLSSSCLLPQTQESGPEIPLRSFASEVSISGQIPTLCSHPQLPRELQARH